MANATGTYNRIHLIGYQAVDPKKHTSQKGTAVSFPLITHRTWKDKEGKAQKKTDFHRVVFFGKFGERIYPHLAKGKKLFIEGELHNDAFVSKDGDKRYSNEIAGDKILFLDRKEQKGETDGDDDDGVVSNEDTGNED